MIHKQTTARKAKKNKPFRKWYLSLDFHKRQQLRRIIYKKCFPKSPNQRSMFYNWETGTTQIKPLEKEAILQIASDILDDVKPEIIFPENE